MTSALLHEIRQITENVLRNADIPGIVVALARGAGQPEIVAAGADAEGRPLEPESVFPVASITKLATALAVLRLAERGDLSLDAPLKEVLPDAAAAQQSVTIRSLLCHTSGLPPRVPDDWAPWEPGLTWRAMAEAALRLPPAAPPFTQVVYSGPAYRLLGVLIERTTDLGIADALDHLVFAPLNIEAYLGVEPPRSPVAIADVSADEDRPEIQVYNSPFSRTIPDPANGLSTTAGGAIDLARAFQHGRSRLLHDSTIDEATTDQTRGVPGGLLGILEWPRCPWGLGPMLSNPEAPPFTPSLAGPRSFGHTGYCTGYVWTSPAHDISWAILGARTYDNGWPITHAPVIEAAILEHGRGSPSSASDVAHDTPSK